MGGLHPAAVLWAPLVGYPTPLFTVPSLPAEPTLMVLPVITGGLEVDLLGQRQLSGHMVLASFLLMVIRPKGHAP
jgi:hypothetical protein